MSETESAELKPSSKAREAINEAAELIANCYCDEEDTFFFEQERLIKGITELVDTRPTRTPEAAEAEAREICAHFTIYAIDDEEQDPSVGRRLLRARITAALLRGPDGRPHKLIELVKEAACEYCHYDFGDVEAERDEQTCNRCAPIRALLNEKEGG